MAISSPSIALRVFLASPGDVADERAFVREFLESILPNDPLLPGRVTFEVVSWDHPHAGTPMPAALTPQEAVIRFKGRPSDCDIVVVILAARLGTHLAVDAFKRPDGTAYLSGTEWEYEDARNATPPPEIMVYRRTDVPAIALRDPNGREKLRQYELVEQFFERFKNPDGSWKGGFQDYEGVDGFKTKLANDLKYLVNERLRSVIERLRAATPLPDTTPDIAPIVPPARCFGRDDDVAALVGALTAPEQAALLVLGPAGIGKTTLTRRVAADAAVVARFAARRWFVELETANDDAALRIAIIQAIGRNPAATTFVEALAWLAQQPGLLVLDNLETPWEQDQRAVQDSLQMLAATPGVSLLSSLRGAAAPPSPRWTRPPTHLRPLPDDEARRLFLELASGIAADDSHLARFLRALGGVPLAVELVALRAAGDSTLRELWEEWGRRGMVLAAHPDLAPDHRLTSLTRSLDLSWHSRRLRDEGRRLFRLLGQLPAGIAEEDRVALLGDAAARQLRTVGLAFARDDRLDLLPPVRDYARVAHRQPQEQQMLWHQHYLTLVRNRGERMFHADGAGAGARLAPEFGNIEVALRDSIAVDLPAAVAAVTGFYYLAVNFGMDSAALLREIAEACRATRDLPGEATCLLRAGQLAFHRADYTTAQANLEASLALYIANVDTAGEAICVRSLGDMALARSQHDTARAAYERALPLYRSISDVRREADCIRSLGDIALRRSQHDTARKAYEQALPLYRRVANMVGEANCIRGLGDIALARSQHGAAQEAYSQALLLYRQVGRVLGEANCVRGIGDVARACSQYEAACEAYEQALPLYRRLGDMRGEAHCVRSLGNLALVRSQYNAAREAFDQALPLCRLVGDALGEGNCNLGLARLACALHDLDSARMHFQEALNLYQSVSNTNNIALAHEGLARVTDGSERDGHIQAARAAWTAIDLLNEVARLDHESL